MKSDEAVIDPGQSLLEFDPDPEITWNAAATIQEGFERFHKEHPEVYDYLVYLCRELQSRGFRHYGIGALWERMRWHFAIDQNRGEDFKLNNNYRSLYARLIVSEHPDLDGFFEFRVLKAE